MPFINPRGITFGHYECRNLDESLAVLSDLFACEIIDRQEKNAQVKHPNTSIYFVKGESAGLLGVGLGSMVKQTVF